MEFSSYGSKTMTGVYMPNWLIRYLERHQHPVSLALHIIGVPMTVAGGIVAMIQLAGGRADWLWLAGLLFIGGYFLQWVGHRIEGNDMGEVVLVKRWLGREYTAISPRFRKSDESRQEEI
jgi:hypothetical protein